MGIQSTQIFALTEALVLWDYIATTGATYKKGAVQALYEKGQLSRKVYASSCPLCEFLFLWQGRVCTYCVWPGSSRQKTRCIHGENSPYEKWCVHPSRDNAQRVFDLLYSIKIS